MQEARTIGPIRQGPWDVPSNQSLVALLALVGSRWMDVKALRERIRLTPFAFGKLLGRLQREYLVEVVSALIGDELAESVQLTTRAREYSWACSIVLASSPSFIRRAADSVQSD